MDFTDCRRVITRFAAAYSVQLTHSTERQEATTPGNEMTSDNDLTKMNDPDFLAERRRVRDELEHIPEQEVNAALTDRFEELNEEFLRRARIAWEGSK
jgi:hypothetical protein